MHTLIERERGGGQLPCQTCDHMFDSAEDRCYKPAYCVVDVCLFHINVGSFPRINTTPNIMNNLMVYYKCSTMNLTIVI